MSKIETTDEFQFGDTARDKITGFKGIITGFATYLTGCTQLLLSPRVQEDGKYPDATWIDIDRLQVISTDATGIEPNPRNGGLSSRDPAPRTR